MSKRVHSAAFTAASSSSTPSKLARSSSPKSPPAPAPAPAPAPVPARTFSIFNRPSSSSSSTSTMNFTLPKTSPPQACLFGAYLSSSVVHSTKLAAYDLDGTLIRTKSGDDFPKDAKDWVWWNDKVKDVVRSYHDKGYSIAIFSNQAWRGENPKKVQDVKAKMPVVLQDLGIPVQFFAARKKDSEYYKPGTGMFDLFEKEYNGGLKVDREQSFYVGDAAGRPADHGSGDKGMAKNIGITFYTPEEHFK
ncbi:hypothetical protein MNV49_006397 [Pseudohyphozyma bogoriensis]|nr:hypothetical protein MNV49_006397 [Pseudohyphozyma bogoriensis]